MNATDSRPHRNVRCWGINRNLTRCRRRGDWRITCGDHRRQFYVCAFVLVFTVIPGILTIKSAWFQAPATPPAAVEAEPDSSRMALQPDSLVPESVFAGGVCPKPDPTDPSLPTAEICVVYWCVGPVFDLAGDMVLDQVQLKIRPRIINNSRDSLRIDLSNPATVRLLVTGKDLASRWMPPSKTQTAGDRPILVQWNGQTYWAMPPNQPQDAYPTPSGMYTGYATVWDGTFLRAGQSYFKPRRTASNGRAIREGDLVFQIPLDASGDAFIAGLALLEFDRAGVPQVLAIAPRHTWPAPIHPDAF